MSGCLDGNSVITWQQLLDEGIRQLAQAGIAEAELDSWYLLSAAFGIDRIHFFMDRNRPVFGGKLAKGLPAYRTFLARRAERVPLQQILGVQDFMGFTFHVNEHVLIPRQDTEKLVEEVLSAHKEKGISILDICTGSGCIGISLALRGGYDSVTLTDISREALKVAKKNGSSLFLLQKGSVRAESVTLPEETPGFRLATRIVVDGEIQCRELILRESDMFSALDPADKFDIIVSNPPYIPSAVIEELDPEVRDYEPRKALDGAEDGLYFYRILAAESRQYLKNGGSIYLEIGYDQAEAVTGLLAENGYRKIRVVKDEPGLDRIVEAVWCEEDIYV